MEVFKSKYKNGMPIDSSPPHNHTPLPSHYSTAYSFEFISEILEGLETISEQIAEIQSNKLHAADK